MREVRIEGNDSGVSTMASIKPAEAVSRADTELFRPAKIFDPRVSRSTLFQDGTGTIRRIVVNNKNIAAVWKAQNSIKQTTNSRPLIVSREKYQRFATSTCRVHST